MADTLQSGGLFHHKQGLGTLALLEGNVSKYHIPPSLLWHGSTNQDFYMHSFNIGNGADDGRGRKATCW